MLTTLVMPNFKGSKKQTAKAFILCLLIDVVFLTTLLSSCSSTRFGNGCPDARRAIGYGCFGGR